MITVILLYLGETRSQGDLHAWKKNAGRYFALVNSAIRILPSNYNARTKSYSWLYLYEPAGDASSTDAYLMFYWSCFLNDSWAFVTVEESQNWTVGCEQHAEVKILADLNPILQGHKNRRHKAVIKVSLNMTSISKTKLKDILRKNELTCASRVFCHAVRPSSALRIREFAADVRFLKSFDICQTSSVLQAG